MEAQEAPTATAAGPAPAPPPGPSREPVISDREEFMVESFALGYASCPESYRDSFVDAWMASHTREQWRLIFTAYLALATAGEFRLARDEKPDDEGDAS